MISDAHPCNMSFTWKILTTTLKLAPKILEFFNPHPDGLWVVEIKKMSNNQNAKNSKQN